MEPAAYFATYRAAVSCWESWPCHARRTQLRAEFDGASVSLGLLMGAHFVEAAHDLPAVPAVPAGELDTRFLGWVRGQPRGTNNRK
ncbi:MAG TPA: flavin reductase [Planosporangium sp.]|nr:flavin reductase [Planosporangium sp.]